MTSASCNASSFAAYQLQLLPLSQSAPKPQPTPTHLATFISSLRKPGAQFHLAQQQKTTLMLITWCCKEVATHAGNLHLFLTFPISIFFCFSLQICFLIFFFFCFFFFSFNHENFVCHVAGLVVLKKVKSVESQQRQQQQQHGKGEDASLPRLACPGLLQPGREFVGSQRSANCQSHILWSSSDTWKYLQQIAQVAMRLLDTHTQDFLKPSDEPETANRLYYVLITD